MLWVCCIKNCVVSSVTCQAFRRRRMFLCPDTNKANGEKNMEKEFNGNIREG